jgi:biopolymer transport protein ExbB
MPEASTKAFEIGPIALGAMLIGSVILLGLAFEQIYTYWRLIEGARDLGGEVSKALYRGDLQAARTACERSSSPVADIFIAALNKMNHPGESVHKAAERERQRFGLWMKRRLWAIGTVGAIAPFVGLFGTVVGIIRAFHDIAAAGAGGFTVVAQGVSEALVATAGGIMLAVLAVALYNYFQSRANRATVEVKLVVDEFLEQLTAPRDGGMTPALRAAGHESRSEKGDSPTAVAVGET